VLDGLVIASQTDNISWLDCDPSSELNTIITNTTITPAGFGLGGSGPVVTPSGPSHRLRWSQHITHNPIYNSAQRDGSLINPLIVQDMAGGASNSDTVVLARGGTVRAPGIVGTLGTSNTGLTLDTESTTRIITTATVASGGAGYNVRSRLFGPIGDEWEVATVSAIGAVLSVTNITPGAYVGAAPTNPVATTTDMYKVGTGATLSITVTGGQLSATIVGGGTGFYQGKALVRFGPPGQWDSMGVPYLSVPNPAGVQAVANLTVTSGAVTGITFANQGSGYTQGSALPFYQIYQLAGSGCTLNLGTATTPNILTLNPSSGVIILPNLPTSSVGLVPGQLWNNNGLLCIL